MKDGCTYLISFNTDTIIEGIGKDALGFSQFILTIKKFPVILVTFLNSGHNVEINSISTG